MWNEEVDVRREEPRNLQINQARLAGRKSKWIVCERGHWSGRSTKRVSQFWGRCFDHSLVGWRDWIGLEDYSFSFCCSVSHDPYMIYCVHQKSWLAPNKMMTFIASSSWMGNIINITSTLEYRSWGLIKRSGKLHPGPEISKERRVINCTFSAILYRSSEGRALLMHLICGILFSLAGCFFGWETAW